MDETNPWGHSIKWISHNIGYLIFGLLMIGKIANDLCIQIASKSRISKYLNYSAIDKICRIIQYVSSGLVGTQSSIPMLILNINIASFRTEYFLKALCISMGNSRKILRFIRSAILVREVATLDGFKIKNQIVQKLIKINQYLGDLHDIFFYLTDHYLFFYQFGVVDNLQLSNLLQFLGHVAWILNAFHYLIASLLIVVHCTMQKTRTDQTKITIQSAILDIFCNINEFLLGFAFIYTGWLNRQTISLMVVMASMAKLIKMSLH